MKKILRLSLLCVFIVLIAIYARDHHFWDRYIGLVKSTITKEPRGQWYSPLEKVSGVKGQPLSRWSDIDVEDSIARIPVEALNTVNDYVAKRRTSSFLVWHDGAIALESYFAKFDSDTPIVSKSMAKPMASMLVARAIQQGHIRSLDQPASDFIDEWQGSDKDLITIRNILNMSSGLWRFYRQTLNPFSYYHQGFYSGKHDEILINKLPLVDEPGSYFDYSQGTSDLIAVIIERSTGRRYADYLATELLQPIGAEGGEIWLNRKDGLAHSGCCVMLPAETWLRLGILVMQDGVWGTERLLPENWTAEILKGSPANANYGLNFWLGSPYQERRFFIDPSHLESSGILQSEPYAADDVIMFDGNGSQVIYIVPSRKLVIVRTGEWPTDSNGSEWDNTFIPNTIIKALDSKTKSAAPPEPIFPPNHAAMQTYQGLSNVDGDLKLLPINDYQESLFDDAIDYAEKMGSYAFLVWHKGALRLEKYFSDYDEDLLAETASMHKSVLALLIAAAIEDGFIDSVDNPIGRYIPEWSDQPEGKITIEQLLAMTSGLKALSREGGAESPAMKFFMDGENARTTLLSMRLESEPGTEFFYANTNSQLLAMVLENATKQPYVEYLSRRLWRAIGADEAYLWNFEPNGFPRAYASLLAKAKDWLKVGLLIKDQGEYFGEQIIDPNLIKAMTSPSKINPSYGWHVWLGQKYNPIRFYNDRQEGFSVPMAEPYLAEDLVYFDGFGGQRVYMSASLDLVIVRIGDTRFDWDDSVLPNLVIQALDDLPPKDK